MNNKLKHISILLLLFNMSIGVEPIRAYSLEEIDSSGVVRILSRGSRGFGTGFFIHESGILVTGFHVVQGMSGGNFAPGLIDPITQDFIRFNFSNDEIIALDPINDIAIFKLKNYKPKKVYPVTQDTIDSSKLVFQKATAMGFPGGAKTLIKHKIGEYVDIKNSIRMDYRLPPVMFWVNVLSRLTVLKGMSGGPLFFENGQLAGVLTEVSASTVKISPAKNILENVENKPFSGSLSVQLLKPALQHLWEEGTKGNREAQFHLGQIIQEQSDSLTYLLPPAKKGPSAFEWNRRSAEQGLVEAQVLLGSLYMEGTDEVNQDISSAIHWFKLASQNNSERAHLALAMIYQAKGDIKQAFKYYQKALDVGMPSSVPYIVATAIEFQRGLKTITGGLHKMKDICSKAFK